MHLRFKKKISVEILFISSNMFWIKIFYTFCMYYGNYINQLIYSDENVRESIAAVDERYTFEFSGSCIFYKIV